MLKSAGITAAVDGCRGIDHGAWVPLLKMYPDADVPVLQLSVQPSLGTAHHYRVGQALAMLRAENVLIVGSGHLTHNLRDWLEGGASAGDLDYARQFQAWMFERIMAHDIDSLLAYRELAPLAARAHPSEEHLLPLFVALGAAGKNYSAERLFAALEGGALAMDAYRFNN